MDSEKPKVNWQRVFITAGMVLFAALVVGGTTWYVMDKSANEIKTANDKSVATLQKQIDELNATKTTNTTTAATPATSISSLKTYTSSSTDVSFKYPTSYNTEDKTATWVGSDENQFPWYSRSDFVKTVLQLTKTDTSALTIKIVDSIDMDKVLGSMGGGAPTKSVVTYGSYKGYIATTYGQGIGSPNIVYTLVGPKYSIAIMSVSPNDAETLKTIIESVTFN